MNWKTIVLYVCAACIVTGVGIIVSKNFASRDTKNPPEKDGPVVVAAKRLCHDTILTEEHVRLEIWPLAIIPDDAATSVSQVYKKGLVTRISPGLPILLTDIVDEAELIREPAIPPGYQVVNIEVPLIEGSNGLFRTGDTVNLYHHEKKENGLWSYSKIPFVSFVQIFHFYHYDLGDAFVMDVLLTDDDAEKVNQAKTHGKFCAILQGNDSLKLRSVPWCCIWNSL